jgi:hypothetical protein
MSKVGKVGKMGIVGIVGKVGKMGKVCTRQPRRFRATASCGHPVASADQPPKVPRFDPLLEPSVLPILVGKFFWGRF